MKAGQWTRRIPSRCAGLFRYAVRGVRQSGRERDALLLQVKAVIASLAAWEIARHWLPPQVTTYAPLTVLLVTRSTVYRSLKESAQYLAAMTVGVLMAAAFGMGVGVHAWSLGVLILLALAAGKLPRLGAHGTQVAVMALFAFTAGQGEPPFIGHLALAILIGSLCGITAHLLLAPSRHTQDAQNGVADLAAGAQRALSAIAHALQDDPPDADTTRHWARHSERFDQLAGQMQVVVDAERENAVFNPRRPSTGGEHALPRLPATIAVLQRSFSHCHSIIRSLTHAAHYDRWAGLAPRFLTGYRDLLITVAQAMGEIGRTEPTEPAAVHELLKDAERQLEDLEQHLAQSVAAPAAHLSLQGTLITDAGRLLSDLAEIDTLDDTVAA
ncbi:aromatic acid exporter family protein [Streptomyces sp. NPDC095817]|uniref:FUSC family protein n=1 Tax=Streptomyces sp. NPDC095817 TaxID=3155082 RepID=UPI003317EBB1